MRGLLSLGAVKVSQDHDVVRLRLPVVAKPEAVTGRSTAAAHFRDMIALVIAAKPVQPIAG